MLDKKDQAKRVYYSDDDHPKFEDYREPFLPPDSQTNFETSENEKKAQIEALLPLELKEQLQEDASRALMSSSYEYDRVDTFLKSMSSRSLKPIRTSVVGNCMFEAILQQLDIPMDIYTPQDLRQNLCVLAAMLYDEVVGIHEQFLLFSSYAKPRNKPVLRRRASKKEKALHEEQLKQFEGPGPFSAATSSHVTHLEHNDLCH